MKTEHTALERPRHTRSTRSRPADPSSAEGAATGPAEPTGSEPTTTPRRRFKEVWLVEDRREGKSIWTRVGVAFENTDGSWNIRLSALPVGSGRLNMRDPMEREAHGAPRVAA